MREQVEWARTALARGSLHPVNVIAILIVVFLGIHPFHDGNGRPSRILTILVLLRAGLEMRDAARALGNDALCIRVGLNSGEATVRTSQAELTIEHAADGPPVHYAARMEQRAEPGTAHATAVSARLAAGRGQVVPAGGPAVWADPLTGVPSAPGNNGGITYLSAERVREQGDASSKQHGHDD